MNHKRCHRRRFCYITLICYSSDRSLFWHYPLLLVRCAGIKWWWSARCVMRRTRLCGWSVFRESGRFKGERHCLHAASCNSSFGNIHKEKKNMSDSWLPRATEWCFMEVLCLGSLNTLKLAQEKAWPGWPQMRWPLSFLMEPPGCRPANYEGPKERVAAGLQWPPVPCLSQ